MKAATLLQRARFFLAHAGYATPPGPVACALALARAEERAEALGLSVTWEDEIHEWDGDCEAPNVYAMASVYHPDRAPNARPGDPHFYVLAHLGGIGLNSMRDPYVRVVEAELFQEALDVLDGEADAQACTQARELAARATYAGVVEVVP